MTRSATDRGPASGHARSGRRRTRRGPIYSLQLDVNPFEVLTVVDAGDANLTSAWIERVPRDDLSQGPRGRPDRGDPDRARWRPFDHLAVGHGCRRGPSARQHRHRPFRCPCRHRDRHARRPRQPWHADAPAHRVGRGQGPQLRPGRVARLLAAAGRLRVDEGAGPPLPLHARDRGAWRRGGHRRRHRRGARRARFDLPLARHRCHRSGDGARDRDPRTGRHAHPRGAPGHPSDRGGGRPRRDGHRRGLAAVRPGGDDRDGRQSCGARGDLCAGRPRQAGGRVRWEG